MKILVIIPAFNEEKSILNVIKPIEKYEYNIDVVVINDGSVDNTANEVKKSNATIINHPWNIGIGATVQTGYLYALKNNYDIAIQIDGDGQHNPQYIPEMINDLLNNDVDIVIGSRYVEKTYYESDRARRIGSIYFSRLVTFLTRKPFYDTTSGFRAVNRRVIELFSKYYPIDYPEVEAIVYASDKEIRIKEISVEMNKRYYGKSSITFFKSIYYMVKVTLSLILQP